MKLTERTQKRVYTILNEQSLLTALLKLFLPKHARYSVDQVAKMRKNDPEFLVQLDALEKSGKRIKDLINTYKTRYPESPIAKVDFKYHNMK